MDFHSQNEADSGMDLNDVDICVHTPVTSKRPALATVYRQCHLWIDDECTVALLAKGQFLSMTV